MVNRLVRQYARETKVDYHEASHNIFNIWEDCGQEYYGALSILGFDQEYMADLVDIIRTTENESKYIL